MNLKMRYKIITLFTFLFLFSCVNQKTILDTSPEQKISAFSNKGFALVYNNNLFKEKIVKGKLIEKIKENIN